MAKAAGVFPSYLSQVLKRDRQLNLDQAVLIADHIQLGEAECEYFLALVQLDRAQSPRLKSILEKTLKDIRDKNWQVSNKVRIDKVELTPLQQEQYYSNWVFTAVRLATAIPKLNSSRKIAEFLGLNELEVKRAIDFLLQTGLCVEDDGAITVGPAFLHVPHASPLAAINHGVWRTQAMVHHARLDSQRELAFSLGVCLSKDDVLHVRNILLDAITNVRKIVDPSPSEAIYCLNIDWFDIAP